MPVRPSDRRPWDEPDLSMNDVYGRAAESERRAKQLRAAPRHRQPTGPQVLLMGAQLVAIVAGCWLLVIALILLIVRVV